MISRNDLCWCGSQKKWKKCHYPEKEPKTISSLSQEYLEKFGITLKTPEQVQHIKKACQVTSKILDELCRAAKEGVTTLELDQLARKLYEKHSSIPATLGYGSPPYPATICTSLNDVICHGFPDKTSLQKGDILNIDASAIVNGYFGDTSRMVMIEPVDEEKQKVVDTSYECMMRAIKVCKPGVLLKEIGTVIEEYARSQGCSVVNQFVGHGVGLKFHEPPEVPHHYNQLHIPLAPGMIFTIEPMINAGVREGYVEENGWIARTKDHKPSAQWEHTILITDIGHEILTLLKNSNL